MENARDEEEWSVEHSYLVVKNPDHLEGDYIFDIARPHQRHNLARVLKPAVPFNYELLKGKRELLVLARDVLQGGDELWFGVGEQASGKHAFIENE